MLGRNLIVILAMDWRKKKKKKRRRMVAIDLWQWNCRNGRKKKKRIVAMELPKIKGERKYLIGILVCQKKKILWHWKLEESITSPLLSDSYSPKYLEYILYSFPIKPNLLISHIGSISWILFYVFISPRYKRQHAPSLNIASPHRKLHFSYCFTYLRLFSAILLFCFASVCTTKNCKFWIKMSFFALLINLQL